jgi:putative hydrolase
MEGAEALREIAFRLERDLAPGFKVQAFRRAAGVVAGWDREQLAARVRDGSLQRMRGIGGTTFTVLRQVAEGAVPDYLAGLRERQAEPLAPGGAELRAQLRGDLHSHTEWSDGTTPIEDMADAARVLGREYQAITDHSPNLTIANGLSSERLEQQLDALQSMNESGGPVRILSGIEVDILEDGTLDQTPDMLDRLDVVVASVHSKLRADRDTMTRRMLGAIADPHTTVLGHCTGRLVEGTRGTRPPSEFDAAAVFAACAERGVAVEINSRPERRDPPGALIDRALEAGCLFSIDTDAHAPGHLAFLDYGAERAAAHGVPAERIITTWPVDRLLEHAHRNRSASE